MGQALYRKYRSKSLAEIIGQEHITETLATALQTGRISHAYLLTGPRGVGKTSIARILAHEINGLPYSEDGSHMDIIEIDAASNRRIDEIRELRDKVFVAPTSAKYKVYIIDEVHMLTKEAFNALLKTLEEPPAHVVFILATTDAHKVPETIISRTQRYSFRPVEISKVVAHLRTIATSEKIDIDDDALQLLAKHGEGSFRDSISMLDQARSLADGPVTADHIHQLLGIPPTEAVDNLLAALPAGNISNVVRQLSTLYDGGYQATLIAKQLAARLRSELVVGELTLEQANTLDLLSGLLAVPTAHDSARYLEICLLRAMPAQAQVKLAAVPRPAESATPKIEAKKAALNSVSLSAEVPLVLTVPEETPQVSEPITASVDDTENWQRILAALKAKHNTLYGLVRMAQPDFSSDGELRLTFAFDFHAKRLADPQNQAKLRAVIKEVTGVSRKLLCLVDKNSKPAATLSVIASPPRDDLAAISNIFGGGELVE